MMFFLFSIMEFAGDFNLVLKILVLLTIANFSLTHLGKGPMSWIVIIGFAYFVLFSNLWLLFGGVYLLYMLLMFGFGHILIDFFFISAGSGPKPEEEMESPVSHGVDLAKRQNQLAHARSFAQKFVKR
ncbi:MAG: hypothetical protein V1494_00135 [Candidatus Diapherotrites archaeon]